jgi:hypothetical protein
MHAHKITEALGNFDSTIIDKQSQLFMLVNMVKANKFYIDNINWSKIGKNLENKILFSDQIGEVFQPYPVCYFEIMESKYGTQSLSAILSIEIDKTLISTYFFQYDSCDKQWGVLPRSYTISLSGDLFKNNYVLQCGEEIFGSKINQQILSHRKGNIIGLTLSQKELTDEEYENDAPELSMLNMILMLLSCKNISTEQHSPDAALNKKRIKRGKQPLFTYHTLSLKPVGKAQESIPKHLWENRIHLARGHFKTFTPDKPLFGKITGRFWWQPQVRGRNRNGVVMKDYSINANDFESIG